MWTFLSIIILLISLSLLLLIPSIQKFIAGKATKMVSEKAGMHIEIGAINIVFPKSIKIENIFIADQETDTLLFCSKIIVDTDLIPILHQKINIDYLLIEGLKTSIYKQKSDSLFNFSPLIDVFGKKKKDATKKVKSPWEIGFDEIELQSIQATYRNQVDSSEILLNLGHLLVSSNSVNALEGKFDIDKIDLEQTSLSIIVASNEKQKIDSLPGKASVKLPFDIKLGKANLENLHFDLRSVNDNLSLTVKLKQSEIIPKNLDLRNTNIELEDIKIDGVDVVLQISPNEIDSKSDHTIHIKQKGNFTFADIPWNFLVNHAEISNTSYKMDLDSIQRNSAGMDYRHMVFSNFNLVADSIFFNKDHTGAKVHELNGAEKSGAKLTHLDGVFFMDNHSILADDFSISTSKSSIEGSASLGYSSLREIGTYIGQLEITSDLHGHIDINEISPFTSVLNQYPLLANLNKIDVENVKATGTLDNMTLINCKAGVGQSTIIQASGHILGLPTTNLNINFELDTLITSGADVWQYLPDSILPENITLPENLGLSASLQYAPESMDLVAALQTELGGLTSETQMAGEDFSTNIQLLSIDIGKIMSDSTSYGALDMEGQFNADLSDGNFERFDAKFDVASMGINGYLFENMQIDMDREKEVFSFSSFINDSAISFEANGNAMLHEEANHYNMDIKIHHANLRKMNFIDEEFEVKLNADINTYFTSADDIEGTFSFTEIMLSNPRGTYKIKEINIDTDIKEDYTNFDFSTDIFDASLSGNSKIMELKNAFNNHINNYITVPDSLLDEKEYHFDFNLSLKKPDFFTEFLIKDLEEISIENCAASYDGANDLFLANINISRLKYSLWAFDSLLFTLNSEGDSILSEIDIEQIFYDSVFVNNLSISSKFANQHANLSLSIANAKDSIQYLVETHAAYIDSSYVFNLIPKHLTIDYNPWTVNPENKLIIKNKNISVESASVGFGDQKVILESNSQNHLKMVFEQFDINNIIGFLKTKDERQILDGKLDGFIDVTDPLSNATVTTELKIEDLKLYQNHLGDFTTKIELIPTEKIDYNLMLRDASNIMKLDGSSTFGTEKMTTVATLEAEISAAEAYAVFIDHYATDLKGGLNGKIEINGNMDAPKLNGQMKFQDLSMVVQPVSTQLSANGTIHIDENNFQFSDFVVTDSLQNNLTFIGGIDAGNIINPNFDLKINASEFTAINSMPGKDKIVVGKLFLSVGIDVKGRLSELKINSKFSINKNTDIMYVLPGKDLELITDNGIVVFTEFDNQQDTIITIIREQFIGDSIMSSIRGIDVTIDLSIDPEAQFSIYVDPNSGDITFFKLKGNLRYKYNDVQRGYLTGLIELEEGYYDLSFYGLVKKKFVYDPGSTISWSGNVMEGVINFTARYEVKTNSVGLVSNEISSYERSLYNQRLPYQVLLNINGQISEPIISFGIELPDRYKNDNPTIASKLQTLEQSGMESELNKQVFALLVGGTFIPENPDVNEGSSSSNFATTAARNSVNAIMTQQLNNLTGQFIKGIDVDMGLNTFDDYASGKANTRTQLDVKVSKNLFNNRVSAEVESHIDLEGSNSNPGTQSTAGMTEFAVSYRLTESGNYSIKAFRENAWDIFDGEIQNSGIAFIFVKEFDSFRREKRKK